MNAKKNNDYWTKQHEDAKKSTRLIREIIKLKRDPEVKRAKQMIEENINKRISLTSELTTLASTFSDVELNKMIKVLDDDYKKLNAEKERNKIDDEVDDWVKQLNVGKEYNEIEEAIEQWVEDTLDFILENSDLVKNGFIAGRVREGTADECLRRIKEYGWKFTPDLVYDPNTTNIHLVPNDYNG